MNDVVIRHYFHKKKLKRQHACQSTLVIDELGLKHGKCRADIAVIDGNLSGFEIKSDRDSLSRLDDQVNFYNRVFDHATIIIGRNHLKKAELLVPEWWGVIVCSQGARGAVSFKTIRRPKLNRETDPKSIAQLLWKKEAEEILRERGLPKEILRQPRSILYEYLADIFYVKELRDIVRSYLLKRTDWRDHKQLSLNDDSCQHAST